MRSIVEVHTIIMKQLIFVFVHLYSLGTNRYNELATIHLLTTNTNTNCIYNTNTNTNTSNKLLLCTYISYRSIRSKKVYKI